jgi:hypothetical protein
LTDGLVKDSKKFEKEQVALAEKKKHLVTKQKKFKKSITDVRPVYEANLMIGWTFPLGS